MIDMYSDPCRILHSCGCVHHCWPTCAANLPVLHSAYPRAMGRACRLTVSVVCSSSSAWDGAGIGNGRRGEPSPVMCCLGERVVGCVMYLGERVPGVMEDNGLVLYVCVCLVHVSMPGTQDHIITLATSTLGPAACITLLNFTLYHSIIICCDSSQHCLQLWCIKTHILYLLSAEEDSRLHSLTKDLHCDTSN